MAQKYFIERTNKRINVFRFYTPNDALKVQEPEFSDMLVNVQIAVDGKKQTAHVTFYKGYLFSIELKKPGKEYAGKKITAQNVTTGNPGQSYTRAIDRREHGRSNDQV